MCHPDCRLSAPWGRCAGDLAVEDGHVEWSWRELVVGSVNRQVKTLSVELPGIEPFQEIALTCGNAGFEYAKRRELTCGYAEPVDGINRVAPQRDCRCVASQRDLRRRAERTQFRLPPAPASHPETITSARLSKM
jgi:hypothetical protein